MIKLTKIYYLIYDSIISSLILVLGILGFFTDKSNCLDNISTTTILIDNHQLTVEIANTISKQTKGLMNRKELPENEGMLFAYKSKQHLNFWMHNTYIPLSIAYIDENFIITEILDMEPLTNTVHRSKYKVKYALEVNKGWFKKRNITAGKKIIIKKIVSQ